MRLWHAHRCGAPLLSGHLLLKWHGCAANAYLLQVLPTRAQQAGFSQAPVRPSSSHNANAYLMQVLPTRAQQAGFSFKYTDIGTALRSML